VTKLEKELYAEALNNALTEIRNICPEIHNSFLFTKDGTVIASDKETTEDLIEKTINSLESVFEKENTVGGLHDYVLTGTTGTMHISQVNDMYLAMVTSRSANAIYLQTIARVLIPTVLKVLENITPAPLKPSIQTPQEEETPTFHELTVETLGGLLVRGDTAQIDSKILEQWSELYEGKTIKEIEIESTEGKIAQCKVKPINDSKTEDKKIIRIPDKVCQALEVKKGDLVIVRPIEP
jgi:predicted regulator of Ras-like GTPase activity (Roadblock/LC7/MglB family)